MKILLVEDSHLLQRSLSAGLRNSGMTVDQAFDGLEAQAFTHTNKYDIIILDVMLPKLDGLEFLSDLRRSGDATCVFILSAKDEIKNRTRGLDIGADDYLIKPFSFDEQLSRLRALSRRSCGFGKLSNAVLLFENVEIDTINRKVNVDGTEVTLTPSEYRVLELLATRRNQTYAHDQLTDRLYRADQCVTRNAVEAHISSLRRKLRSAGAEDTISIRRGFGYYIQDGTA